MIPVLLTKIKTRDRVVLDGIVAHARRKHTALIWIHGLASRFYSGQKRTEALIHACADNNIGFFNFNTRGHDIIERGPKPKSGAKHTVYHGAGFEKFTECVYDIRAMILFVRRLGYKHIILAGHSTGANKVLYYMYKKRDRSVKGLMLLGPINDIAGETAHIGATALVRRVKTAERLKKSKSPLMPIEYGLISPARYLSLYRTGSAEDVFPYHNPRSKWKELASIKIPIATMIGARDEYLDRTAKELIDVIESHAIATKVFSGVIIKNAGHSFRKKEPALAKEMVRWIKKL